MKSFLILLSVLAIYGTAFSARNYYFGRVEFGMSMEEAVTAESNYFKPGSSDELAPMIQWETHFASQPAVLSYQFFEDQLYKATYTFGETHGNPRRLLDDYRIMYGLLTNRYGATADEGKYRTTTNTNQYTEADEHLALVNGDLIHYAYWYSNTTEIGLYLYYQDSKMNFYWFEMDSALNRLVQQAIAGTYRPNQD